jgi:2-succinyl-6-hydroxy-2,4-cyclohexadiene-1-carboxylate synthase
MGHPTDWDEIRCCVDTEIGGFSHPLEIHAPEIQPAKDWDTGISKLAEQVPDHSIVIGYSMGARLALALAIEFPERIAGLMLISGNPGIESDDQRKQRFEHDSVLAGRLEKLVSPEQREVFLEMWYQQPVFATIPDQVRNSEIARKLQHDHALWSKVLRTFSVAEQPNYWPRLNAIEVPIWMVAGQNDEKYSSIARRIVDESQSSKSKAVIVKQSGHIVHREQTQGLVQIIGEFLQALEGT